MVEWYSSQLYNRQLNATPEKSSQFAYLEIFSIKI